MRSWEQRDDNSGGIPTFLYDLQDPPITASWHLAVHAFQKPSESHVQYLLNHPATRSEPNQAGKSDKSTRSARMRISVA